MKPDLPADPERWRRIEALLDEMFEHPAGERRAFLDEACAGNPELRAQMEALLTADEEAGGFLATPAHQAAVELLAETSGEAAPLADRELGPYRLVREIGSLIHRNAEQGRKRPMQQSQVQGAGGTITETPALRMLASRGRLRRKALIHRTSVEPKPTPQGVFGRS